MLLARMQFRPTLLRFPSRCPNHRAAQPTIWRGSGPALAAHSSSGIGATSHGGFFLGMLRRGRPSRRTRLPLDLVAGTGPRRVFGSSRIAAAAAHRRCVTFFSGGAPPAPLGSLHPTPIIKPHDALPRIEDWNPCFCFDCRRTAGSFAQKVFCRLVRSILPPPC